MLRFITHFRVYSYVLLLVSTFFSPTFIFVFDRLVRRRMQSIAASLYRINIFSCLQEVWDSC